MSEENDKWLSVAEVADELGLSKMTVYRMIEQKQIVGYKFGKMFRVKRSDLDAYISNSKI